MSIKNPLVHQNWLDKAITFVSPKLGMQRIAQRAQLAMVGGYNGARLDKAQLSRWGTTGGSANADIIGDLPALRARSSDQLRNAPIAIGAVNTNVSNVVGTGLSCTPAIDREFLALTEEEATAWIKDTSFRYQAWSESKDCDLGRRLNFYGIQELAYRSELERGDVFVLTPMIARAGFSARLALQLIEADQVCNPNRTSDTDTLIDGIEIDPKTGETVRIHVAKRHPGDYRAGANSWSSVDVRGKSGRLNVLHIFKLIRIGQVRGVPWIAPILEPLKQLGRWSDAELNAAVISASFAMFVKMDWEGFQEVFDEDAQDAIVENGTKWSGEIESGKATRLLPGESIDSPAPGRPNPAFDPFWCAMVRQIGMALETPFEVLIAHFQSSYTAARGALLMAYKHWKKRRDDLITNLCKPVYELWLADEVANGRISCPGFFASELVRTAWCKALWTGDGPGSIDPLKEIQAAQQRVDAGISTLEAESILHDGVGWVQKHEQRVREINAQKRDDIYFPPKGVTVQQDPAATENNDNAGLQPKNL